MTRMLVLLAVVLSIATVGIADTRDVARSARVLARKAVSENSSESAAAIATLRARGQAGLEEFLDSFSVELRNREIEIAAPTVEQPSPEWLRISNALDQVCQQRDCYTSRLFWYTDFDAAKAAAKLTGKPILSLRLLGRLDEELSCANSRFFRLILYSNTDVSALLREHFILHWQSVRPVPKVTIDFGDGRKLERTLTGNSIHYVLDSEGRPIDALPGLYGPQAFIRELKRAERVVSDCRDAGNDEVRASVLREYHNARINELAAAWTADMTRVVLPLPLSREAISPAAGQSGPPRAEAAARGAISKMVMAERPVLRGISSNPRMLDTTVEDLAWGQIARLHADDARISASSKMLMLAKNPGLYGGATLPARSALEGTVSSLERSIAEDTVRNEFVMHSRIHEWFARATGRLDLVALNDRVYRELFLTPGSDPWLGLLTRDGYTGIENDGVRK